MSSGLSNLFAEAAHLHDPHDTTWLDEIVRRAVDRTLAEEHWHANSSSCRFTDIGDFLLRAVALLSRIAESLSKGRHIAEYTKSKVDGMKIDNDFSELNPLYHLQEKHSLLLKIAARLQKTSLDVAEIWDNEQPPSSLDLPSIIFDFPEAGSSTTGLRITKNTTQEESWENSVDENESDRQEDRASSAHTKRVGSETLTHDVGQNLSSSLSRRGKGRYQCQEWETCSKGGKKDGRPVIFERNSAFRRHVAKHKKPYKCGELGCDSSFGRLDHLRRHQQSAHEAQFSENHQRSSSEHDN